MPRIFQTSAKCVFQNLSKILEKCFWKFLFYVNNHTHHFHSRIFFGNLTYFMSLISFDITWKYHKYSGFLMFSGGTGEQWHKMASKRDEILKILSQKSHKFPLKMFSSRKLEDVTRKPDLVLSIYSYLSSCHSFLQRHQWKHHRTVCEICLKTIKTPERRHCLRYFFC